MSIDHGLFAVAKVLTGDGRWAQGREDTESPAEGVVHAIVGICAPGTLPTPTEASTVRKVSTFSLWVGKKFNHKCAPAEYAPQITKILTDASEYQVTRVFWNGSGGSTITGTWDGEVSMASADVQTVATDPDPAVTLSKVLSKAHEINPHLDDSDLIIHLGYTSAQKLGAGLNNLGLSWVVGQGYPETAVAVTGPITIWLGSVETTENEARISGGSNNRFYVEATRLAKFEFDIELAVKAV